MCAHATRQVAEQELAPEGGRQQLGPGQRLELRSIAFSRLQVRRRRAGPVVVYADRDKFDARINQRWACSVCRQRRPAGQSKRTDVGGPVVFADRGKLYLTQGSTNQPTTPPDPVPLPAGRHARRPQTRPAANPVHRRAGPAAGALHRRRLGPVPHAPPQRPRRPGEPLFLHVVTGYPGKGGKARMHTSRTIQHTHTRARQAKVPVLILPAS